MQKRSNLINNWGNFYWYSILLGLRNILKNPLKVNKEALKRIIIPMDIARYFEIPYTYRYLKPQLNEKIFDLSSPKLLSLYISENDKTHVTATDVWDKEIQNWKTLTSDAIFNSSFKKNLQFKVVDGRKIPYKSGSFDKAFTVSVIEHIENNGDSETIKEIARILKPGGVLVLTTPYGKKYKENWVNRDAYGSKYRDGKPVFLSRIYNKKTLDNRIIKPSGLILEKKIICEEKHPFITTIYTALFPFSAVVGLLFPIFSIINLRVGNHAGSKNNVLLVLRKKQI